MVMTEARSEWARKIVNYFGVNETKKLVLELNKLIHPLDEDDDGSMFPPIMIRRWAERERNPMPTVEEVLGKLEGEEKEKLKNIIREIEEAAKR
jgi:GTP-binding protein EngB required for normal cell division